MKNLRRWHLYLGCFFTPLLLFYLFSGFILTRDPSRQKLPSEAETLLQKFYWVHTAQFYPADAPPQHPLVEIESVDIQNDTLTLAEPGNYPPGLPARVINIPPAGLDSTGTYFAHPKSPKTLTLHRTPADAKTGTNPIDLTDEGLPPLTFLPENPPPRGPASYPVATFRWFGDLMSLGVLATMTLGIILAVKVVKDKRPVLISLAVGFVFPCLLLMLGHLAKPAPEKPQPETPANPSPQTPLPGQLMPGDPTILPPGNP